MNNPNNPTEIDLRAAADSCAAIALEYGLAFADLRRIINMYLEGVAKERAVASAPVITKHPQEADYGIALVEANHG